MYPCFLLQPVSRHQLFVSDRKYIFIWRICNKQNLSVARKHAIKRTADDPYYGLARFIASVIMKQIIHSAHIKNHYYFINWKWPYESYDFINE